jgi:ubiquinone/menaquinone biosynthesis C-methylase UbiE
MGFPIDTKELRSTSQTRDNYNKISNWYDIVIGAKEIQLFKQGIKEIGPLKNGKILEIGCGTGKGLLSLNEEYGSDNSIYGLDLSDGMLKKSITKIQDKSFNSTFLIQADAFFLPFGKLTFEAVILGFTLELFPDDEIPSILLECKRVIKQNGKLVIIHMAEGTTWMVNFYKSLHRSFPKIIDCKPIEIGNYLKELDFKSLSVNSENLWGLPVNIATINF